MKLGIDDFGTGFSSLSYLGRLPIDTLKVDRSFVTGIERDDRGRSVVAAILRLAESLGLETIAEGIETPGQLAALLMLSASAGQGHLFAAALDPAAFAALLSRRVPARRSADPVPINGRRRARTRPAAPPEVQAAAR